MPDQHAASIRSYRQTASGKVLSRKRRNFRLAVWLAGSFVIVATATVQVFDVFRRLEIVVETTESTYSALARMLAEQAGEAMQLVDVALRDTVAAQALDARGTGDSTLRQRLRDRVLALPQIEDLIVVDAGGHAVASADATPNRELRFAEQAWFLAHREGQSELHVSASPLLQGRTVAFSRRLAGPDGRFRGVVVAFLDLDYFRRFYAAIGLDAGAQVRLMNTGGGMVVSFPDALPGGTAQKEQALFEELAAQNNAGVAVLPHPVTGDDHVFAVESVSGYPFAVGTSVARSTVLLPWHTQVLHSAVRTSLLCLSVALLMWLVLRELRHRERAEESLRVQTALLDELFDSAPEAIVMLDPGQRVTRVNREFTAMFGYSAEEAAGQVLDSMIVPENLRRESERMASAANRGQRAGGETERLRKDGSRLPVSVLVAPIMMATGRIATYAIYRDISERRLAEAERTRLELRLRHAEKLEAIGTMAGGIAHDFNNILAAILGYGDMALNAAPEAGPLKRYVGNVLSASQRARALVDQILSYGRSTRGRHEVVNVASLLDETLELVRASLPPNIELDARVGTREACVVADPTHIHQLGMNLCTNAIQAMDRGGVLAVTLEELHADGQLVLSHGRVPAGRLVVLAVSDTGRGMDAALLARIFEPFFTTKASGTGTGLGLAMVQSIVNELGGAIDVASEPGKGSRFAIFLPRSDDAAMKIIEREQPLPRGRGERVLVVDDERPLMLLTEEMLAALNYEPAGFSRSADALDEMKADPQRFDAAVVDHLMPGMSGTELAHQLRTLRPDLPIIMVSPYTGPVLSQEALTAGVEEVLPKPLDFRTLAHTMAQALAHPER
jgi:PAS domain S-box-containing protein